MPTTLVAGATYVLCSWYGPRAYSILGMSPVLDARSSAGDATRFMIVYAALSLPAVLMLAAAVYGGGKGPRRWGGPGSESKARILLGLAGGAVGGIVVDRLGAWPWVWRSNPAVPVFSSTLLAHHAWVALTLMFLTLGILNPAIEELVFRNAALKCLTRLGRSRTVGVVTSSALFSILHFGPRFRFSHADIVPLLALFLFGILLGVITLRLEGRVAVAVAIHSGRNLAEQAILILALMSR